VIKTLGPYYDTWIDAIDAKVKKGEIEELKVRLVNPPEPFNLKYTIIEYENQNGKLVKTRSYDKE